MSQVQVLSLDAATYAVHGLHAPGCAFVEKNCYIDVWIECLHARGLEPLAAMPFVFAIDFEIDQWTFFKPPHADLWRLYGIDVQELNVWRPLLDHVRTHLSRGSLISSEVDAFHLPDTRGTDYQTQHTKSTVIINAVDVERRRLGYFHNAGYFELEGRDFDAIFRGGAEEDPCFMPLFAETIRIDRARSRSFEELAAASIEMLREQLARRPLDNPVRRFADCFAGELENLQGEGIDRYHAWAFANTRQLGAAFEIAAHYLRWLGTHDDLEFERAALGCEAIGNTCKSLILKGARAVMRRKAVAADEMLASVADAWDQLQGELDRQLAR